MRIKGAIFDLDGTLLDSMFIWDTIGEDYLKSQGILPKENLNETFKSMSLLQAAEYYQSEYGLSLTTEEIMDGVNDMIEHFYADVVLTKPGVAEFLEKLKKCGTKMCVATATDKHLVKAALERNGILNYFSEIFTCTEVGAGKDNPLIFNRALAHLGTNIADTLVFEDALYAIKTAKGAGFTVCGVEDTSEKSNQAIIKNMVDIYIHSYLEMRDFVDEKSIDNCRF